MNTVTLILILAVVIYGLCWLVARAVDVWDTERYYDELAKRRGMRTPEGAHD